VAVTFVSAHPDPTASDVGGPPASSARPAAPGLHNAFDGMQRWDSLLFEWIAAEGYSADDASGAIFPGYPILIAGTARVTPLDEAASAVLVGNVAFALSLIVLFALTSFERRSIVASKRSVLLFACLPTSFFFLAPLSEAPFLLACLLAFYWARTGRWGWRVAAASFAACLLRSVGVALVVALVVEAVRQHRAEGPSRTARVASASAGLLAPLLYALWWWGQGESPLLPLRAQSSWHRELTFPLVTVGQGLRAAWDAVTSRSDLFLVVDAALLTIAVVWGVSLVRRWTPSYGTFFLVSLLIPLSYAAPWRPLLSIPRFAAVLFPGVWVAERSLKGSAAFWSVAALCLACQMLLALEFMQWGWIY
jgi:hypothetical protein